MERRYEPLTFSPLIKKGDGAQHSDNNENYSLNRETEPTMVAPEDFVATTHVYPPQRFKKVLNELLSIQIIPESVPEAVKNTPLGDKITYQQAILIAQILKASNGDTQAAVFLRDTSGNKLKDGTEDEKMTRSFEDF